MNTLVQHSAVMLYFAKHSGSQYRLWYSMAKLVRPIQHTYLLTCPFVTFPYPFVHGLRIVSDQFETYQYNSNMWQRIEYPSTVYSIKYAYVFCVWLCCGFIITLDMSSANPFYSGLFHWHWGWSSALQWRSNGCDSVSNHQPHHYSFNRLFKRRS